MTDWRQAAVRLLRNVLPHRARTVLRCVIGLARVDKLVRAWSYDHLYDGEVVRRRGLQYRLHKGDYLSRQLYVDGEYGSNVLQLIGTCSPHFKTFVDCGAHIGAITVPMAKGFAGHTIAIEPASANFRLLEENVRLNDLDDHVRPVHAALGDRVGSRQVFLSRSNSGDHRMSGPADELRSTEVVALRLLDDVVFDDAQARAPYLIKIDVQGYECRVFAGAERLVRQPCMIVAEFWPDGLRTAGDDPLDFLRFLGDHGLRLYQLPKGKLRLEDGSTLTELAGQLRGTFRDVVATNLDLKEIGLLPFLSRPSIG